MRIIILSALLMVALSACKDDENTSSSSITVDSSLIEEVNKPLNIILITADNLNQQVFDLLRRDANAKLVNLINGYHYYSPESYFDRYADAQANYTALFSGKTTINGHLGMDKDSVHLGSWIDSLKAFGYSQALITNGHVGQDIYGAAFSAKTENMPLEEIRSMEIVNHQPDFIWATGRRLFTKRKDEKDLFKQMVALDYHLDLDINRLVANKKPKYAGIFFNDVQPDSLKFIRYGIETWKKFIQYDERPFFLWLHIQDLDKQLKSGSVSVIQAFNRDLDALLDLQKTSNGRTLIIVVDAFQSENIDIRYFKSDSINVQLTSNAFQFTSMPIWTYGLDKPPFGKYLKNTDLGKSLIDLAKK